MKIIRFGPDTTRKITQYGSDFALARVHRVQDRLFVECMYIPPGGKVGYHQASTPQVFMVVDGTGAVRAGEGAPVPVGPGDAALWDPDEWHEATTDSGMTAVVIQYNFGGPIEDVEIGGRRWTFYLATGRAVEQQAREQLERLLAQYDLSAWSMTTDIMIDSFAIPHSHPVLTLSTRHIGQDDLALAALLHEQIHWYAVKKGSEVRAAIVELRRMYPDVPTTPPEGARDEQSTYLHLAVNYLEYDGLRKLLGEARARTVLQAREHYTWIYRKVLEDGDQIRAVLDRYGMLIPSSSRA